MKFSDYIKNIDEDNGNFVRCSHPIYGFNMLSYGFKDYRWGISIIGYGKSFLEAKNNFKKELREYSYEKYLAKLIEDNYSYDYDEALELVLTEKEKCDNMISNMIKLKGE